MRKICFFIFVVILNFSLFSIENLYIENLVKQEISDSFSNYVSFNVEVLQAPVNANLLKKEDVRLESIDIKPAITIVNMYTNIEGVDRKIRYLVKINVFDEVLVLSQRGVKGNKVELLHLDKKLVNVTSLLNSNKKWIKHFPNNIDYRFNRSVRRGSVLLADSVEKMPDININDTVSLKIVKGPIELFCEVVALQEGFIGQTIDVMHEKYQQKISAIIKDNGLLEVNNTIEERG
jgi:flagella basal body P-ring formation protein FlgA